MEVHVEERALAPVPRGDEAPLALEACMERRARERRQYRHLHLIEAGALDEVGDGVEALGAVAVEPEDEAAVHRDAAALDAPDRALVAREALELEVAAHL